MANRTLSFGGAISMMIVACGVAAYLGFKGCGDAGASAAKGTGEGVATGAKGISDAVVNVVTNVIDSIAKSDLGRPRITIDNLTVIVESKPIHEVATFSKKIDIEHKYTHRWLGSEKVLKLRGFYTVKAGFQFDNRYTLNISSSPLRLNVRVPPPVILSIEQDRYDLVAEDGHWNKLGQMEQKRALDEMKTAVRKAAEESMILSQAREEFETKMKTVAAQVNAELIIAASN